MDNVMINSEKNSNKTTYSVKEVLRKIGSESSDDHPEKGNVNLRSNADLLQNTKKIKDFCELIYGNEKTGTSEIIDDFMGIKKEIIEERDKYENEARDSLKYLQRQRKISDDICQKQQNWFDSVVQKHKELTQRIENLLPGATAAGLSEAYEMSINEQKNNLRYWTTVFYVSLLGILGVFLLLAAFGSWSFKVEDSLTETLIKIIRLITFESPLLWIAIIASRKINQYTMLIEEYRHKWATMRVYDGMRKAVKEIDKENLENSPETQLFIELLKTVQKNPTISLESIRSDNILEQLKGLLNRTSKSAEETTK